MEPCCWETFTKHREAEVGFLVSFSSFKNMVREDLSVVDDYGRPSFDLKLNKLNRLNIFICFLFVFYFQLFTYEIITTFKKYH